MKRETPSVFVLLLVATVVILPKFPLAFASFISGGTPPGDSNSYKEIPAVTVPAPALQQRQLTGRKSEALFLLYLSRRKRTQSLRSFQSYSKRNNILRPTSITTLATMVIKLPAVQNNEDTSPSSSKKEGYRSRIQTWSGKAFQKLLEVRSQMGILPPSGALAVALFAGGYQLGLQRGARNAVLQVHSAAAASSSVASSATAASASSSLWRRRLLPGDSPSTSSFLLTTVLIWVTVREVWRLIPLWLKKQIPLVNRKYKKSITASDENDLSSVSVLSGKLRGLFQVMSEKLDQKGSNTSLEVAFLALLQLMGQIKAQQPQKRDDAYAQDGENVRLCSAPSEKLHGYDDLFEFADYAYDELQDGMTLREVLHKSEYTLLRHDTTILPGSVAHYIAISKSRKTALVGIKGTSGFEDMLTDICGNTVERDLGEEHPFVKDGPTKFTCHEGIMAAADRLSRDMEDLVSELFLPNNYKIIITGHSLGAGVAALIGLLLRSRIPALQKPSKSGGNILQVYSFASPPVLSHDAALACKPFVTTVVNNSDIIPRSSVSNLIIMAEFLKIVHHRLDEENLLPRDFKTTTAFLRALSSGDKGEMLMSTDDIFETLKRTFDKVELEDPLHLYVPGRVFHMIDTWSKQGYGQGRDDTVEGGTGEVSGETSSGVLYGGPFEVAEGGRTAEILLESDGTSGALRFIEIDSRMMTDHLSPGYRSSLRSLLTPASQGSDP